MIFRYIKELLKLYHEEKVRDEAINKQLENLTDENLIDRLIGGEVASE